MESEIQLITSGIQNRILKSEIQPHLESRITGSEAGIHSVESGIQDCLGLPYIGWSVRLNSQIKVLARSDFQPTALVTDEMYSRIMRLNRRNVKHQNVTAMKREYWKMWHCVRSLLILFSFCLGRRKLSIKVANKRPQFTYWWAGLAWPGAGLGWPGAGPTAQCTMKFKHVLILVTYHVELQKH